MRSHEAGVSLVEVLVALLLVGLALVPLLQHYPSTLGFNLDAEVDMRLSAAAVEKAEELVGLLRSRAGAEIAFDASTGTATGSDPPPVATSATITIGPEATYLVILIGIRGTTMVSAVRVGGTDAVRIRAGNHADGRRAELWGLASPPTGTRTITVTLGSAVKHAWVAASFRGVRTAGPLGGNNGNTGSSNDPVVAVSPRLPDTLLVGGFLWNRGAGNIWEDPGQTAVSTETTTPGGAADNIKTHLARETTPGGAWSDLAWTITGGGSRAWVALAVELRGEAVAVAVPDGLQSCDDPADPGDLSGCLVVWTTTTELSSPAAGVGTLRVLTVVACEDTNANGTCDGTERQVRYDAKITSRP